MGQVKHMSHAAMDNALREISERLRGIDLAGNSGPYEGAYKAAAILVDYPEEVRQAYWMTAFDQLIRLLAGLPRTTPAGIQGVVGPIRPTTDN